MTTFKKDQVDPVFELSIGAGHREAKDSCNKTEHEDHSKNKKDQSDNSREDLSRKEKRTLFRKSPSLSKKFLESFLKP